MEGRKIAIQAGEQKTTLGTLGPRQIGLQSSRAGDDGPAVVHPKIKKVDLPLSAECAYGDQHDRTYANHAPDKRAAQDSILVTNSADRGSLVQVHLFPTADCNSIAPDDATRLGGIPYLVDKSLQVQFTPGIMTGKRS